MDVTISILNLIFAAVVAIATVIYVYFTLRLVKETIRLRNVQTDPSIVVYAKPKSDLHNAIELYVKNIGLGVARELKFVGLPKGRLDEFDSLRNVQFLRKGISVLGPNEHYKLFLTILEPEIENAIYRPVKIRVYYKGNFERKFSGEFEIDLKEFYGIQSIGNDALKGIDKSLKKLATLSEKQFRAKN